MVNRLHSLQHKNRLAKLRTDRLKAKLNAAIDQSVLLDAETSTGFQMIMREQEAKVMQDCEEGSFKQVFWQQQSEAISRSDRRGMRWHPLMIKWCLYLRHQSSKAYETLRESGCIQLPTQRTLRDYSNCVKARAGFSAEVDRQLFQAAELTTCQEWQKLVVILMDEMHIREDLVYDKHSGQMIGFCNLGTINDHLLSFERGLDQDGNSEPPLAKSVMVFMVRGLFTTLRFVYSRKQCTVITLLLIGMHMLSFRALKSLVIFCLSPFGRQFTAWKGWV